MNNLLLRLYVNAKTLAMCEDGQDLVEYALVVAMIALGSTVAMNALASGINTAFNNISTQLGAAI